MSHTASASLFPAHRSAASAMRTVVATAVLLAAGSAWSATPGAKSGVEARYQQDRAACMSNSSQHERTSCLREAGAVRAEALKGAGQGGESQEMLMRNAMERCKRQPAEQQAICERMARGEGSSTGSVESGGVIRELTIMEPAKSTAPQAPAPVPGATPLAPLPSR